MATASVETDQKNIKDILSRCCYLCGKHYTQLQFMWDHLAFKHSYYKNPLKFSCTHCGDQCKSLDAIVRHELKNHGLGFACHFCGITCQSKDDRIDHFLADHLKPDVHICGVCKKEFQTVSAVESHIQSNHTWKDEWIDCLKCHYCKDYFKKPASLFNHVLKDHWQLFTSLCKSCGQLFNSMLALRRHRSDSNQCLDGVKILVDSKSLNIKFDLPSNAEKVNSFKEEMEEIMNSTTGKPKKKKDSSKRLADSAKGCSSKGSSTKIASESGINVSSKNDNTRLPVKDISKDLSSIKSEKQQSKVSSHEKSDKVTDEKKSPKKVKEKEPDFCHNISTEVTKLGREITTVDTDIFDSDPLRKKQKDMLLRCCYICCKIFFNNETMWHHVATKHSYYINPVKFSCTHCGKSFKTLNKLVPHELEEHGFANACHFCGKGNETEDEKVKHIISEHLEPECKVCMTCKKEFDTVDKVEQHIKSFHRNSEGWIDCFQCDFCQDLFKKEHSLFKHIISDHWELFTFLCKSCGQLFHSLLALRSHRSDRKNCLDDILIPTDKDCYEIKFQLPAHASKTNSFKDEMDEILESTSHKLSISLKKKQGANKRSKGSPKASTSKELLTVDQNDLDRVLKD